MVNSKKVIIALDGIPAMRALKIAKRLQNRVWGFKINDLIYKDTNIILKLKKFGKIFVDVKLHDIPNTASNSTKRISRLGADIITVHASGGIEMMRSAKKSAGKSKIIAVTVLTSEKSKNAKERVSKLATWAIEAGVDGVVCSGHELRVINKLKGIDSKLKIIPGIRPLWYKKTDDQSRIMTPEKAMELGADYLVIGRPITEANDVIQALRAL